VCCGGIIVVDCKLNEIEKFNATAIPLHDFPGSFSPRLPLPSLAPDPGPNLLDSKFIHYMQFFRLLFFLLLSLSFIWLLAFVERFAFTEPRRSRCCLAH